MKTRICVIAILGNPNSGATRGVVDKVTAQVAALRDVGYEAHGLFGVAPPHQLNGASPNITALRFSSPLGKIFRKNAFFRRARAHLAKLRPDVVYLRYPLSGPALLHFLLQLRRAHPEVKIIVERQTKEIPELLARLSPGNLLKSAIELSFRGATQRLIDFNVGVTQEICDAINSYAPKAYCIPMGNGLPSQILEWCPPAPRPHDGTLRLVFVGNITPWSGLEFVIDQLRERNFQHRGRAICLDVIGEGVFLDDLRARVAVGSNEVVFHGFLYGEALWQKVAAADVALGALNNQKRLLKEGSNLKLRLYAALGVPFVLSEHDTDFSNSRAAEGLFLDVSGDGDLDAASMASILDFALDADPDLRVRARAFACSTLTWQAKMGKMMHEILEASDAPS